MPGLGGNGCKRATKQTTASTENDATSLQHLANMETKAVAHSACGAPADTFRAGKRRGKKMERPFSKDHLGLCTVAFAPRVKGSIGVKTFGTY